MKIWLAISLMALAFNASAKTAVCNTCTTDSDYKARAKLLATQGGGVGPHYVVNSATGVTKKYTAFWDYGEVTRVIMTEKPVEASVNDYVRFVMQSSGRSISINLREDLPENGYELMEFPQLQRNTGTYINDTGVGFMQGYFNVIGAVGSVFGFNAGGLSITVKVVMPDGSNALYTYNHTTMTWVLVPGTIKDGSGNYIPRTREDFAGGPGETTVYYFYNPNDLANFLALAANMGIPITGPIGNIGSVTTGDLGIVCQGDSCEIETSGQ